MKAMGFSGSKSIGCIGRCTSGLDLEQLDLITDHVHRTLEDVQGRKMFANFLGQAHMLTDLRCLELYEQCVVYIDKELYYQMNAKEPNIEPLLNNVNLALSAAEDLDNVPEIDLTLLEKYTQTLENSSRQSRINLFEETKYRMMNHLRQAHKGFRTYIMQPCPRS